jgi:hypothetical protein
LSISALQGYANTVVSALSKIEKVFKLIQSKYSVPIDQNKLYLDISSFCTPYETIVYPNGTTLSGHDLLFPSSTTFVNSFL